MCGICGEQSGTGTGFLRLLRFPQPVFILPIAPQSPSVIWGWYNRPVVAAEPNGLCLNHTKNNKKILVTAHNYSTQYSAQSKSEYNYK
jgi:hypothetical protein